MHDPQRLAVLRATGLLDSAPEPAFDRLTALVTRLLHVPVALVSLVDRDRQFFKSQIGLPEPWASRRQTPLSHSFCQYAVARGGELIIADAPADDRVSGNLAIPDLAVIAYAGVPIEVSGQHIGVLCAVDHVVRSWTQDEMEILRELARLTEAELQRREAIAELDRRNQLLDAVFTSMEDMVMVADRDGNLIMTNEATDRLHGPLASVEEAAVVGPARAWGLYAADGVTPMELEHAPLIRALAGETVRQAELLVRVPRAPEGRWQSVNASPLRDADGLVTGAVVVARDITRLREIRTHLESAAIRDELTGLLNRRGFRDLAHAAVQLADRKSRPLALFYVDLNGMKTINDRLGHATGDRALVETAELLRATFRATDLLARLGGDEFVALAPEYVLGDEGASVRARLRALLLELNRAPDRPFRLSLSIGTTLYDPAITRRTIDELLGEADARMYEAKQARAGDPTQP